MTKVSTPELSKPRGADQVARKASTRMTVDESRIVASTICAMTSARRRRLVFGLCDRAEPDSFRTDTTFVRAFSKAGTRPEISPVRSVILSAKENTVQLRQAAP